MNDERNGLPSASYIDQIYRCPGSWNAQKGLPRLDDEEDANAGDAMHAAIADRFTNPNADTVLDLTPAQVTTVEECIARAEELSLEHLGIAWRDAQEIIVERRLWAYDETGPISSAKPDLVLIHNRKALIVDFKTGWVGAEDADVNLQLRTQAICVEGFFDIESATVAIVSPNAPTKVTVATYTKADIEASLEELRGILSKIPNGQRVAGPQCRWCRAKHACPEALATREAIANAVGVTLNADTSNKAVGRDVDARLATLTGDQLSVLLEQAKVAEWVVDQVKACAKARLAANPNSVPGWQLKPGVSKRSVKNAGEAFAALNRCDSCSGSQSDCPQCKGLGIVSRVSSEAFLGCVSVKISELDAVYKSATGMKLADAKADLERRLGSSMERKTEAPRLERA